MRRQSLLFRLSSLPVRALAALTRSRSLWLARPARMAARLAWSLRGRLCPGMRLPYRLAEGPWLLLPSDDHLARLLLLGRPYEEGERLFVRRFLRGGDNVVDAGANYGLYTLISAVSVGAEGRVWSFEPAARERAKLGANVRLNGLENVVIREEALSDREGDAELYVYSEGMGAWSSMAPADIGAPCEKVAVRETTLDGFAASAGLGRLDLLKVDVEGAEDRLFRGAKGCLAELRPVVLCEFSDPRTAQCGYSTRDIWSTLVEAGYSWFEVDSRGSLVPHPEPREHYDYQNLVAVPPEKMPLLQDRLGGGDGC
jgi:FkbM family methyltransferase